MQAGPWAVRSTSSAKADFSQILRWTTEQFGAAQARLYVETLVLAIEALSAGPDATGCKARDEIGPNMYTLHVARHGRKGRHLLLFRTRRTQRKQVVELLRILHDSMDLSRHLPPH